MAVLIIAFMAISPKRMTINVSETIDAPQRLVYNLVNDLKAWEEWSPMLTLDPEAVNTLSDKTQGVGATWYWKGNEKVGEGTRKIISSVLGDSVKTQIEFNGWDALSYEDFILEPKGKNTKISYHFIGGETAFPFRPFNVLKKGGFKKTLKNALEQLKKVAEKRAEEKIYRGFKIKEVDMKEKYYLMARQEVNMENIQQFYAQNLGALFVKAQGANITMDGMPSGLYYKWDEHTKKTDMAAGIPISEPKNVEGATLETIPSGRAIQIDFYGDYADIGKAHQAIDDYMNDYGLLNDVPVVEEYVTDPGAEKDPSKWLTKVTYYISGN
jgi:effector-binding domain-containing protein